MPTQIDVERITFTFGDTWDYVTKWDDDDAYCRGVGTLQGELNGGKVSTKAVDLVGVQRGTLFLIEVKDFRRVHDATHGTQAVVAAHGGRWQTLPLEVALKVRDTLAGLTGCSSLGTPSDIANSVGPCLRKPLRVQACVLQDPRPSESNTKRKVRTKEMTDNLKRRLAWVCRDVKIVDPMRESVGVSDVTVANRLK